MPDALTPRATQYRGSDNRWPVSGRCDHQTMEYGKDFIHPEPERFGSEADLAEYVLGVLNEWFEIEREVGGRYWTGEAARLDAVLRPRDPAPWFDDEPAFGVEFKLPPKSYDTRAYFAWAAQAVDYTHCDWRGYGRLQIFLCPSPFMEFYQGGRLGRGEQRRRTNMASLQRHQEQAESLAKVFGDTPEETAARARNSLRASLAELEAEDEDARGEGFWDALDRSQTQRQMTGWAMAKLLGQLGVGELMPHRYRGWMLLRSGVAVWSQRDGARSGWSLKPHTGHR